MRFDWNVIVRTRVLPDNKARYAGYEQDYRQEVPSWHAGNAARSPSSLRNRGRQVTDGPLRPSVLRGTVGFVRDGRGLVNGTALRHFAA